MVRLEVASRVGGSEDILKICYMIRYNINFFKCVTHICLGRMFYDQSPEKNKQASSKGLISML